MTELAWILRLAKPLWRQFAVAALLALATAASGLGLLATAAFLIASAALQPSIADLQLAIVGVRFLGIARGVLRYAERYFSHQVTFKLLKKVRVWFYRRLEPLAPAVLGKRASGDLLARLIDDIETLQFFFLRALQPPLVAAIGASILAAILLPINGQLTAVWLALLASSGLLLPLLTTRVGKPIQAELLAQRAQLKQTIIELLQGMGDFLANNATGWQQDRLWQIDQEFTANQKKLFKLEALVEGAVAGLTQLAPIAVLWLMIPAVEAGRISGVGLAVLVVASLASFELVTPMITALPALEASLVAARRLLEIAQSEPPIQEPAQPLSLDEPPYLDLKIQDLYFSYGSEELPALRGINLTIPQGQHWAVVGPSGAGKSTLFNLLLRFWDYERGSIQLAGQELQSLTGEQARSQLSVVSQRTTLFSGSLRHNLQLAKPEANSDELIEALTTAGASDLLLALPQGLDTEIGEWGWRLSLGQQRRVVLARALLQDRPYLLLDEPTANLDPDSARHIMSQVLTAGVSKTILLITHQLVGLQACDQILVLDQGRIRQRGRHQELAEQPGLYRRMWRLQVERWQVESELSGLQPHRTRI